MISSEQNCWVFALEQKKGEKKKTVRKSAAEPILLSRSEFKSQYEQNSTHESSWLRLLKRKKSMISSEQKCREFVLEQKKKNVLKSVTEAVLLPHSEFKWQD